jgi:putative peptidoglycan lipid II flippase
MPRRSLARAALFVGGFYIAANIMGFLSRIIIANRFGAGAELDAFYAAFRVPDLLFNVLAGGALASAFIPVFTGHLSTNQHALAWALARHVALIVVVVLMGVALVAAFTAPWIIHTLIAPGFTEGEVALTASLMRIMLFSTVIFGVSGLLMGVLQSNESFLAPAIAPVLYNVGIILGATLLSNFGVHGLALGVVIGAVLHLGVQLPALVKVKRGERSVEGWSLHPSPVTLHSDLRQILTLMLPRIVGLGAVQLNFIVNTNLASTMSDGALAAITYAFAIMILPQAAIAQAIGTVLFPAISAHAAKGERAEFSSAITRAINVIILLSAAATVGLMVLGQPLIALLFQRGRFDAQDTTEVAFALALFSVGLVAHSVLEVVMRGFYALKDTRTPVVLSVLSVVLNIGLSIVLVSGFRAQGWLPFGGLALANAVATWIETIILFALLARREPSVRIQPTLIAFGKSALAGTVMAVGLMGWLAIAGNGPIPTLIAIVLGAALYFGAVLLLRSDEATFAVQLIRRRVRSTQSS